MSGKKAQLKCKNPISLPWLCAALCGAFFLIQGVLLPHWQKEYLEEAWRQEIYTVQILAGGLLENHPQLEHEVVTLLQEGTEQQRQTGAAVLSRYGYSVNRTWAEKSEYYHIRRQQVRVAAMFVLTGLVAVGLFCSALLQKQGRQLRGMEETLDQYLEGDYQYADQPTAWKSGRWPRLEERLRRLGNQIQLQQQLLVSEKEGTKALVTDISHQLKTPIAALKTCFELYLEAEDAEEQQEFLQRSLLQMDKLEGLTGALVNISRLEAAMITLQPEPVGVKALLRSAMMAIQEKANSKDIHLEWESVEETLCLDRRWTVEALVNLLDNAVKYSPSGSRIFIRTETTHNFIRIEIQDQGIGVPKGEAHSIFQRFYRGSHPLVKECEGSGVGLYLTRSILEQQGGSVAVRRAPGGGSIFVVQLPRS